MAEAPTVSELLLVQEAPALSVMLPSVGGSYSVAGRAVAVTPVEMLPAPSIAQRRQA